MKYFVNEDERKASGSTCFFEFQKGKYHNKCWLPDSISIDMDIFDDLKLYELIKSIVPNFDYYGLTEINANEWEKILSTAHSIGGKTEKVIQEANEWATTAFSEFPVITICGI